MAATLPFELTDKGLGAPFDLFVDGKSGPSKAGKRFDVRDPGSGDVWASCLESEAQDVEGAVQSSHEAFQVYSRWTPKQRSKCLLRWGQLIEEAKEDLARMLVHETGKPLAEARMEVDYGNSYTSWCAAEAERIFGSTITSILVPQRRSFVIKQPVGVVAALIPWNFPVVLTVRKAATALAAGCTVVMKPSPESPVTALALARLAERAGFPPGAFNVLTTSLERTPEVATEMCRHPLVRKVTFTGSTRVGKIIAAQCGQYLKETTLELGGNCPFVVFEDADLKRVVDDLTQLKWRHAGQACISANRVYVQRGLHDQLVAELVRRASELRVGHGMAKGTTMGSLTRESGLEKAEALAEESVAKGARLVLGTGKRRDGGGFFMEPTIIADVADDMLLSREEIFAPLMGISAFDTEDEVVERANKTSMGLASYVFTRDASRLWRMFEKLEAGTIGMNTGIASGAEVPFGGCKESGWGREGGREDLDQFLITKAGTMSIDSHW